MFPLKNYPIKRHITGEQECAVERKPNGLIAQKRVCKAIGSRAFPVWKQRELRAVYCCSAALNWMRSVHACAY
jgi:hypothetical protein